MRKPLILMALTRAAVVRGAADETLYPAPERRVRIR